MAWLWYVGGDSGMTDKALLGGALNLGGILVWRYVCLYGKPELLEERGVGKKTL